MKKADEHDSSRMTNLSAESNPLREGDGKMSAAQYMGYAQNLDPEQRPIINSSSVVTEK